jgi:hypothetical protein
MSRISTIFWSLVLGASLLAVALGFASGQSIGRATGAVLHRRPGAVPSAEVARHFERELSGAHSLDAADEPRDAYDRAEDAVAVRPEGWAPDHFDARMARAKIALVVLDAGTAGTPAHEFVTSPIPFTLVIPAGGDDGGILQAALAAHRPVLVDARGAEPADVKATIARGALGAIGTFPDDADAARMAAVLGNHAIALDVLLGDDDAFYRAARAAHLSACTRDVILDGRDEAPLMDQLFEAALLRAQRTGIAIVALHARPHSLAAAERFAVRADRDDVDLVGIDHLLST